MKVCTQCGVEKPLTDFYLTSTATGKRKAECKACSKARLHSSRELCTVPGCERTRYSRTDWCSKHYMRVKKWGSPDGDPAKADPSYRGRPPVTGPRVCTVCGMEKPLAEFYARTQKRLDGESRYFAECKECTKSKMRSWKAQNSARTEIAIPESQMCSWCRRVLPGTAFARNRSKRSGIQSICYACHRDRRYGLATGEYERRLAEQNGVCAICRQACPRGGELCVDHDHATGRVRGLLCTNCNAALGMLRDDPALFGAAIDYLKKAAEGG